MKTMQESSTSTFAKMVDKLRDKSEEELKMLYTKFFSNELIDEWKNITHNADFNGSKDDEIIKSVQKNRYKKQNE